MRLHRDGSMMAGPGFQHLRPFLVRQWRALAGAGAMSVLLTIAELARPWPLKYVIDHVIGSNTGGFTLTSADYAALAVVAVATVAIAMLEGGAQFCSDLWLQRAGERIAHRLRSRVYDHLQALSLHFHLRREKGDLVQRVTSDVNSIGDLFAQSVGSIFQGLLLLFGMLVIASVLDPILALTLCVSLPLLALVSFRFRVRVRMASRRQRAQEGVIASRATEALSAMPVIKAFGSERIESERVSAPSEQRMALGVEVAKLQAAFNGLVTVLVAIGTAAIVVVGALRIASGSLSVGDLVVFATYAQRVNRPLRDIAREWTKVAKTLARADRIGELLALDDVLEEKPHAYNGGPAVGAIELEDVTFEYEDDRPALRNMSLKIEPGERIAIIGPSGAGKSTLSSLIARFHDPTSGRVLIDGRDVRDCSVDWLREQVGVLLQETVLFTGTVEANIAYGSQPSFGEIVDAARIAVADDFIDSLPEGYDTELGPLGVGLSGGQRQRVGIARTVLRNPAILILDEPTTGLDVESERQVLDGLDGLMRGRTTIMVTHSFELARRANRVLVVDAGRVVAKGPPEQILADGGPWRRLAETRRKRTGLTPRMPVDRQLPQLRRLLDRDEMTAALARTLDPSASLSDVEVLDVRYKPADRLTVHYRARVDGREHHAAAYAVHDGDLAERTSSSRYRMVANMVEHRSPAPTPATFDARTEALISWLPFDVALPALFQPPERLVDRMQWAGLEIGEYDGAAILRYKPRKRAVLRLDGHVLKAYANRHDYLAAIEGAMRGGQTVRAPQLELGVHDLRMMVYRAIDGEAPDDAIAVAPRAGGLLATLHGSDADGLPRFSPVDELAEVRAAADLTATLVPSVAGHLESVVRRLDERLPAAHRYVASHGHFHAGELLEAGDELFLIDFDAMRLAPPALDIATWAAHLVHGDGNEWAAANAAVERLLDGYGARPEALDWYLAAAIAKRAAQPFKRQVPDWEAKVKQTVRTAQEALDA
jgi:ATP-binding cassette subfamily B protein